MLKESPLRMAALNGPAHQPEGTGSPAQEGAGAQGYRSRLLRTEDPAFGALPWLQCSPKTFRGRRWWLHSVLTHGDSEDFLPGKDEKALLSHTYLRTPKPQNHSVIDNYRVRF